MRKRLKFEALEPRELLAADLIITEFLASNDGILEDGDGDPFDWIEIYNHGDESVDLQGYHLTDNYDNLSKWSFPTSAVLDPNEFLVVFASGNDSLDSAGNFHTNFSLSDDGEYLALVDPSGSVLSAYGSATTDYGPQDTNISYGVGFLTETSILVTPESTVQYLRPSNGLVDGIWMMPDFDDSTWQTGTASLGYELSGSNYASAGLLDTVLPAGTRSAYVRIPFQVDDPSTLLTTLQMKYDDGFIAYINGTRVASASAPETLNYLSTATGSHDDSQAVQFVDFNIASYTDLLHEGENLLAIHMLNRSASSSDMLAAIQMPALLGDPIDLQDVGQLTYPTPGQPNTPLLASDVIFSQTGGVYSEEIMLALSTSDSSETIRYTIDGSDPTEASYLYTGPFSMNRSRQIRARSFGANGELGQVRAESYTFAVTSASSFNSDLPIIVLENWGGGTPGTTDFETAALNLYEVDPATGRASFDSAPTLSTLIGQHRRGKSTAGNAKTNLRVELRDETGEDKEVSLLGMPSESDWILYAPFTFDRAMLRNTLYYDLSRQLGKWAPRIRFVEVYANFEGGYLSSDQYMGVYVLMENVKRDGDRVDIDELTPTQNSGSAITGGYMVVSDTPDSDTPGAATWRTDRNNPTLNDAIFINEEPEYEDLSPEQIDYIRGYIQDFEDALYGPNSTDPELGYEAYFEVDTSIDHHILRLLSKEPDSLRLSTYLTKERDGKLAFGPVWDFDRSSGPDNDARAADPQGWYLPDVDFFESDWWGELFDDPDFAQRWVDRWQELRSNVLSDENLLATINGQAAQIAEAQARNFVRWSGYVVPNSGPYADPALTGWEGEVSHLANWVVARANWVDKQLMMMPAVSIPAGNVPEGQTITLQADSQDTSIYYTLDGSDPRDEGGALSPSAILYTGPITVNGTLQLNARSYANPLGKPLSSSYYLPYYSPSNILDGDENTQHINLGGAGSGLIITPEYGLSVVQSFVINTVSSLYGSYPTNWILYGTNNSINSTDNSTGTGEQWTLIDSGSLQAPGRSYTSEAITVDNTSTAYSSYKLVFSTVANSSDFGISDLSFYQTPDGTGTPVLSPNDQVLAIHSANSQMVAVNTGWSSLVSNVYSAAMPADATNLRISELHYHPAEPNAAELQLAPGTEDNNYEFLELTNTSGHTISLTGVQISGGITYDFSTSSVLTLAPGESVVVVENLTAFHARYGESILVAGVYDGKLSNGGEQITVTDIYGQTIVDFTYSDDAPWPDSVDGDGPSLEVTDPFGDYSFAGNWHVSASTGGTPGEFFTVSGDFDRNGIVDMDDYQLWKSTYGSTTILAADGNQDGTVSLADYTVWRDNLGATVAALAQLAGVTDSAPTPATETVPGTTLGDTSTAAAETASADSSVLVVSTNSAESESSAAVDAAMAIADESEPTTVSNSSQQQKLAASPLATSLDRSLHQSAKPLRRTHFDATPDQLPTPALDHLHLVDRVLGELEQKDWLDKSASKGQLPRPHQAPASLADSTLAESSLASSNSLAQQVFTQTQRQARRGR
ncbi:CotH kinase family protein [Aeoliella mucimassa]|uniref:CotH protein n=1 Tax=Aeoliella mucimassa TaxID=2527972 RepID=A0A518ASH1_9BACT|nr:CotH kinase family protein [Aeoliella mucimassa]QDU57683.1 CotH protein [Aeoliella mucimassa]